MSSDFGPPGNSGARGQQRPRAPQACRENFLRPAVNLAYVLAPGADGNGGRTFLGRRAGNHFVRSAGNDRAGNLHVGRSGTSLNVGDAIDMIDFHAGFRGRHARDAGKTQSNSD